MEKLIYSIKDTKSGLFNGCTLYVNDNVACRDARTLANDKSCLFGIYPGDYDLYCIGKFDDITGAITSEVRHVISLASLVDVKGE